MEKTTKKKKGLNQKRDYISTTCNNNSNTNNTSNNSNKLCIWK